MVHVMFLSLVVFYPFNFRDSWNKLGNMPKDIAAREYVEEVTRVCPEWETQVRLGLILLPHNSDF